MAILYFHLKGFKIYSQNNHHHHHEKYYYVIYNHKSGICSEKFPFLYGKHRINEYFHIKLDNNKHTSFTIYLYKKGLLKDELVSNLSYDSSKLPFDEVINENKLMNNTSKSSPHILCRISIHLSSSGLDPYNAPEYNIDNTPKYLDALDLDAGSDSYYETLL
ncbi:hypothetical protein TVAG_137000 [Trichomonas vaginalis G3]|uniref:Uncharacterized protein n=1 Tax=Trichomonas vaginalis (strain ATCC PRA-98 / G3) TaxID=412133 RepID=A2G5G9_TRIV3|nr:hypothetical protein TVAGG3_0367770 [Trichomonas vaginalis G3]EAX87596.1 hypothetical protein TVAG_137000 [Trichomonas vaginalis G3]KAI5532393.1 hypothetical protein TVAGG3_0367770 [Trichomonas vaginalis G3]|eukprot:XP_001300526.1 hypothetical protein [Trichomonas vaginalis G3]